MKNLDLDLLRTFVAVAEARSFATGGIKVGRTQSAVTQQMQRLEATVALSLFEKQGRNKSLTTQGYQLLSYAREILRLNDDAVRAMGDWTLAGVLRIGSPHDISETLLPVILEQLARWAPNVRIELDVGRSPFLMEALHRGEIDLTLSNRIDDSLQGALMRTSPTAWICAASYVHVPENPVPLVVPDGPSVFGKMATEALDVARIRWRHAYIASNLLGVKAAIRARLGVTARSIEMLGPDMRVLGESDGLPRLPDLDYYLWARPSPTHSLVQQAFDLLAQNVTPQRKLVGQAKASNRSDNT